MIMVLMMQQEMKIMTMIFQNMKIILIMKNDDYDDDYDEDDYDEYDDD